MTELQKVTKQPKPLPIAERYVTDDRMQALIDFRALSGLITDDNGIKKMTADELANQLGVARKTLYEWQKLIPDFWGKVAERRKEIAPRARLSRVHETWYLKAVKGDFHHMQLWLANFDPNFRMPTEKLELEAGNSILDLVNKAKNAKEQQDFGNRKVIDVEPTSE